MPTEDKKGIYIRVPIRTFYRYQRVRTIYGLKPRHLSRVFARVLRSTLDKIEKMPVVERPFITEFDIKRIRGSKEFEGGILERFRALQPLAPAPDMERDAIVEGKKLLPENVITCKRRKRSYAKKKRICS